MKIELNNISIKKLSQDYTNEDEKGVFGYNGKLSVRPIYQREFIYSDKQRNAVIETVRKNFPLNVIYWAKNNDGTFEVLDGQQRTISICEYIDGNYSIDGMYFHNLTDDQQEKILNYELMVYFCEGSNSEKLEWFKIINIAGEELEAQELRNAVYSGPWLTDAKSDFSKTGCRAYEIGSKYLQGSAIRQKYLETAIKWISENNIEDYMSKHQHKHSAIDLWNYFSSVIDWTEAIFKNYRREMKGVEWGYLYNSHKNDALDPNAIEEEITNLMMDDMVQKKKGIYEYILKRDEKLLNLRAFTDQQKREMYESQKGLCAIRKKPYPIEEMEADHIDPWIEGGKTEVENGQMIHKEENRRKSNK
ncbi:DUF262 domain-containing protein [Gammaproteobacteria bacterium]|nr:DUF262 domain-containing protein [Gammaproteobacteria bacterium]